MHNDSYKAYVRLSDVRRRRHTRWMEERIEEALDIILRQPDKAGNPAYIARNAMKDAGTKLKERQELLARRAAEIDVMSEGSASRFVAEDTSTYEEMLVDVVDMIRRGVRGSDGALLMLAMMGGINTAEVAANLGISEDAARQRLHRARGRATDVWNTLH